MKHPLTIAHLSSESTWRGGERQIYLLHQQLVNHDHNSLIICRRGSVMHDRCRKEMLTFVDLPFKSAYDLMTAWHLLQIVRKHAVNLLHIHTSKGHTIAIIAQLMGLKVPMILSRRVDQGVKKNWFSRFKYGHKSIREILCVSQFVKKKMAVELGNDPRLRVVYSGITNAPNIDKKEFLKDRYQLAGDACLVGNTSAIVDHKDYFTFVDTATILLKENPNVMFIIMGEGPLNSQVEAYISNSGFEDNFIITGFISDVSQALTSLDVFLFTSKTEGLGTSVLDAMAAGVPVVATRAGGVPEMIEHGKTGLLAPVMDSQALASCVKSILENDQLRSTLIKNAREKVKSFSAETTYRETYSAYSRALSS